MALVCLALLPPFGGKSAVDPEPSRLTATTAGPSLPTIPIEQIRPGDWALAHNPELTDEERWAAEQDELGPVEAPDDWRLVWLRMEKPDGSDLQIELLRPVDWFDGYDVQLGAEIDLDLEELGADGPATVLAIHRCPQILPRPGPGYQLVTGRFAHSSAEVLDLVLIDAHGEPTAIGVTASLPFWNEDQEAFVPASHLTPGTRLLTATGDPIQLATITPRPGREPVFNIEVDVEHVYHVGAAGVLVHNMCHKRGNAPNSGPAFKTWNQFQSGTKGQFANRAEAAKAWDAYMQANGIVTGTVRSSAAKRNFLKGLADDPNTPSWMKQWLGKGKVPPGYDVDHTKPLSIGGADAASNMRQQLRELHKTHHKFYRPWE